MPQVKNLSTVFAAGIINTKSAPLALLMRYLYELLCVGAFLIGCTMALKNESDWLLASLYIIFGRFLALCHYLFRASKYIDAL